MNSVKTAFQLMVTVAAMLVLACGCCNTKFKQKQLRDDLHAYFADGDPELLSEAEPDSAI